MTKICVSFVLSVVEIFYNENDVSPMCLSHWTTRSHIVMVSIQFTLLWKLTTIRKLLKDLDHACQWNILCYHCKATEANAKLEQYIVVPILLLYTYAKINWFQVNPFHKNLKYCKTRQFHFHFISVIFTIWHESKFNMSHVEWWHLSSQRAQIPQEANW